VASITQRAEAAEAAGEVRRRMPASDRRVLILEAARESFADGGYHQTSLDAVAERAGVSKALIYEHFDSKRELHAAMLEAHVTDLIARLNRALEDAEPGEARLRAGTEAFFAFLEERRGAASILLRNTSDPDVAEWLTRLREQIAAQIVDLMTAEVEELVDADPAMRVAIEMFAQQLIGGMQSLADWWGEHRDVPREQVVAAVMSLAWTGLDRVSQGDRSAPPASR
jgi:AcrR family transcriptional regulator